MICPHCQYRLETPDAHCPECGIRIVSRVSGIVKTSGVLIAAGEESTFYRSVQEVPETLRRQLIESTNSANSGMIVIADRAGKEQWTEIVARREAQQVRSAGPASPEPAGPVVDAPAASSGFSRLSFSRLSFWSLSWATWAGILLFLAAAAMIASVFQLVRW